MFFMLFFLLGLNDTDSVTTQQEMTVTASMVPEEFSETARHLTVLGQEDIQALGVTSFQELFKVLGIQVQVRGALGIQSDISMRGASFEQTLVLLDGIKLSDPQTGHHLLNIPVNLDQVERIEILRGPGARIFGPNAFGGVINVITKRRNQEKSIHLAMGEHGYREEALSAGMGKGPLFLNVSLKDRASDGYIDNTDFSHQIFNTTMDLDFQTHSYRLFMGEDHRDFGANRFYHPDFPDQREETRARLFQMNGKWHFNKFNVEANAFHRRHHDDFVLDHKRPDWYRNIHETQVTGLDIKSSIINRLGALSAGSEFLAEKIDSSNLGNHKREKWGLFLEQQIQGDHFDALLGASGYEFSDHGWEWWPGMDLAWKLPGTKNSQSRLFFTTGRSFRLPTFTELYYIGGGNAGNPQLNAETAWNYELGYRYQAQGRQFQGSWFLRQATDMIDWVWNDTDRTYYATNFSDMDTQGLELEWNHHLETALAGIQSYRLFYTYLSSTLNTGDLITKYLVNHPRNMASIMVRSRDYSGFSQTWVARYEEGQTIQERILVDVGFSYHLKKLDFNLAIDNLTNHKIEDFLRVPLPGRWVRFSCDYNL